MPTPHNQALFGEVADKIMLPGDPKRAELIANRFLENPVCFNEVRGMLGFTGTYDGEKVSVMGTGMGMPSIGIVAHELISEYDVKKLVRVGSVGAYRRRIRIGDIIIAQAACTDSNFAHQYGMPGTYSAIADYELLSRAVEAAKEKGIRYHVGNILSSDVFYNADQEEWKDWQKMGVLGTEMESYALFCEAALADVAALTVLTVSDNIVANSHANADQREKSFENMVEIALAAMLAD